MKTIVGIVVLLTALVAAGEAPARDDNGGNSTGSEKVCSLGPNIQNEQALSDALKSCKRGDILDIGWVQTPVAMQLCDFTKQMLYNPAKGSVIACVYTGTRRPSSK